MMMAKGIRFLKWSSWALLVLYAVKPSVVILTYVTSACFVNCDVHSAWLYKVFGSPATRIVLMAICALAIAAVIGVATLVAKKRRWRAFGVLLMILLLPSQFSKVSLSANLCFGSEERVSVYKGWFWGKKIPSTPNNCIMAVRQKGIGYAPYAIFNGFDFDGTANTQIGDFYVATVGLNQAARSRLSRILEKQAAVGYLVVRDGEMHYVDGVNGVIQEDGMRFALYWSESADEADDVMYSSITSLAWMPDVGALLSGAADAVPNDDGEAVYRGRILDLNLFVKRRGIKDCGTIAFPPEIAESQETLQQ